MPVRTGTVATVLFPLDDATPHVSGGRLCLGHVNTVLWRRSAEPEERLTSYTELVRYVARAGWLDPADELIALADAHPRRTAHSRSASSSSGCSPSWRPVAGRSRTRWRR
jgi:Putative stress-induced transcription regulator